MDATDLKLRKSVLAYVNSADHRLLRMMQALAESYGSPRASESGNVPEWFYEQLDTERAKHLNGETESRTWKEVKKHLEQRYGL